MMKNKNKVNKSSNHSYKSMNLKKHNLNKIMMEIFNLNYRFSCMERNKSIEYHINIRLKDNLKKKSFIINNQKTKSSRFMIDPLKKKSLYNQYQLKSFYN